MALNVKKCKHMCYNRTYPTNGFYVMNGDILEPVNFFNELGIIFDCIDLNWTSEVILYKLLAKLHLSWGLLN